MTILLSLLFCGCGDSPPPEPVIPDPTEIEIATFGEETAQKLTEADHAFDTIDSPSDLARARTQTMLLLHDLEQPLQAKLDAGEPVTLEGLEDELPGLDLQLMAEGTSVVLVPAIDPWKAKATATPGESDDRFVAAMDAAYDNIGGIGWPAWQQRNWDYGGCNPLGRGVHLKILVNITLALDAGTLFREPLEQLRSDVVESIVLPHPEFPFCDVKTGKPTDPAAVLKETRSILTKGGLTDGQAADVRRQLAEWKKRPPTTKQDETE